MHPLLSARQEQCLRLTAFRTDKEIAAHLGISEATVKKHVHEACQRLGVNRRKAALALLDPIVPEQGSGTLSNQAAAGYPKRPMARAPLKDQGSPFDELQVEERDASARVSDRDAGAKAPGTVQAQASGPGRMGYRSPPENAVLRIALILVLTVVLTALVVTVVVMLGDMHEAVGRIDAAATEG